MAVVSPVHYYKVLFYYKVLLMNEWKLYFIIYWKELCHDIQPNQVIAKCPLN